jgi:hypothetical protein
MLRFTRDPLLLFPLFVIFRKSDTAAPPSRSTNSHPHRSLNTFKKHGGNQVNPQLPGELRDDQVLNMADQEIRAPYFFNLPVCDIQTSVWAYFYGMKNNPSNRKLHFPCDAKYDEL